DRYDVYDNVLDALAQRGSGVDEIELMTNPASTCALAAFPVQMVAKDTPLRGDLEDSELARRLRLGNLVLRTSKLPRYRRQVQQQLSDRLHPAVTRLIDPRGAGDEYTSLAYKSAQQGDLEQAQLLYDLAL